MIFNAYAVEEIENKETLLRCTKLWENDASNAAFGAQTITLPVVEGVIFYIVEYRLDCSNSSSYKSDFVFPKHHTALGSIYYSHDYGKWIELSRNVTIADTSAVFSADSREDGSFVVPTAIYAFHL